MTGHGGTALTGGANNGTGRGGRLGQAEIVCDCGRRFTATRTLIGIKPDHYESPEWEAHVRASRTVPNPDGSERTTTERKAQS